MILNHKQRRFVAEYVRDLNGRAAAIRAGYSAHSADRAAQELVSNRQVSHAIEAELAARSVRTGISADRVLQELARIAFADFGTIARIERDETTGRLSLWVTPTEELSADDRAAISEVKQTTTEHGGTLQVKLHDKLKALDMLAKHLGLTPDKVEQDITVKVLDFSQAPQLEGVKETPYRELQEAKG